MFRSDKHIKNLKSDGRDDAEVTGDDWPPRDFSERWKSLVAAPVADRSGWYLGQILADRARRHSQAEYQQQFVCNALLTPRATMLKVKPLDALPTGFTGSGITGNIPAVNLWATLPQLCGCVTKRFQGV
jgi:hypothetical protein